MSGIVIYPLSHLVADRVVVSTLKIVVETGALLFFLSMVIFLPLRYDPFISLSSIFSQNEGSLNKDNLSELLG